MFRAFLLLVFFLTPFAFAEGGFMTAAERREYDKYLGVIRDSIWNANVSSAQRIDFCNQGDSKKFLDIPIFLGSVESETSFDAKYSFDEERYNALPLDMQEFYTVKALGHGPMSYKYKVKYKVKLLYDSKTDSWFEPENKTIEAIYVLKAGMEIADIPETFWHRQSRVPTEDTTRIFTPYGFSVPITESSIANVTCKEGKSLSLFPYEATFSVSAGIVLKYRELVRLAELGDFDSVAAYSKQILNDSLVAEYENSSILALKVLSQNDSLILSVDSLAIIRINREYFNNYETYKATGEKPVGLPMNLRRSLELWRISKSAQNELAKKSPEVASRSKIFAAKLVEIPQSELNEIVDSCIVDLDEASKEFMLYYFSSKREIWIEVNASLTIGEPFVLENSARKILGEATPYGNIAFEVVYKSIVSTIAVDLINYDLKDKAYEQKILQDKKHNFILLDRKFNFSVGYRLLEFAHFEIAAHAGLAVECVYLSNGSTEDAIKQENHLGYLVGGTFNFYPTKKIFEEYPVVDANLEPRFRVKERLRLGLRLRVEYSTFNMPKTLDVSGHNLNVSAGIVMQSYRDRPKKN